MYNYSNSKKKREKCYQITVYSVFMFVLNILNSFYKNIIKKIVVLFVQKKIRDAWRQVTGKNICKTYVINKKGIELYDGFNQKKKDVYIQLENLKPR